MNVIRKNILIKFYSILIGVAFVVVSCRKETTWDADWVVPLINDTLDLKNLVNDSTLDASGGFYNINLKRTLLDINVSDFVSIPDTTIAQVFVLGVSQLNVPPGTTFVNSVKEHELKLQDIQLKKIILTEGEIELELRNPLPVIVKIDVQLPGVTLNGQTFTQTYFAPASTGSGSGILNETLNLGGYTLDLTGISGGEYNLLRSKVTVSTLPDGGSVLVTNQDQIVVNAKIKNAVLKYARGYFGNRIIQDTTDFNIDFFQNIVGGTIDLPASSVKVKLENSIKFDAQGKISFLENENNAGTSINLTGGEMGNTFLIDQPTGSYNSLVPSFVELIFNSGNSNIENYFENLGVHHKIAYEIKINPWGNTSGGWNEIFEQSRIKLSVEANLPLAIQMDNLIIKDTFDFVLNQSEDKTRVVSGSFTLKANNAFPFSGAIKLLLLDEFGQVLHQINGTNEIMSSLYGSSFDTQGIQFKTSEIEFPFSEDVVANLDAIKFVAVQSEFDTPDPATQANQMVAIPAGAYLGVKLKAKFKLKTVVK